MWIPEKPRIVQSSHLSVTPEAVVEAAFLAIRKAGELIDMRLHQGEHPRMGATDVCPLIPIQRYFHGRNRSLGTETGRTGR